MLPRQKPKIRGTVSTIHLKRGHFLSEVETTHNAKELLIKESSSGDAGQVSRARRVALKIATKYTGHIVNTIIRPHSSAQRKGPEHKVAKAQIKRKD